MIRLAVASDSHDWRIWLERFRARCEREKYDAVFHLGDLDSDAEWLERKLDIPLIRVTGNCDAFCPQRPMATAMFEGRRVLAVHGHMQGVKGGLVRLSYFAEENGADIALFGHTHEPCVEWLGGVLLINPGALKDGRFAELVLDGDRMTPFLKDLREKD